MKNNIDINLYNEKSLYLLNIKELRDLGRKFGVPSPTTMKKKDLIDYILKVVYGEIDPPIRSCYGRPNSRQFDMNKYIDKIKKNSDFNEELVGARLYDDEVQELHLKASSPKNESQIGNIEQRVVYKTDNECFLRIRQFVVSDNDYKLENEIANRLKLENFDVVEIVITDNGIKIISINGTKISNNINTFIVNEEQIMAGMRKVFHYRTKEKFEENIEEIKKACNKQDLKFITLVQNSIIEGAENFELVEEDNVKRFKKFVQFVEYIKKLVYENHDIIVVIEEMSLIENLFKTCEEEVAERFKNNLNKYINDFIKLGNVIITFNKTKSVNYSF